MRKPAAPLPKEWGQHIVTRTDVEALLTWLSGEQSVGSSAYVGERLALAMLEKSPAELRRMLQRLDNDAEAAQEMTSAILDAEESLTKRLEFVTTVFARIAIASGVVEWSEQGDANG